MRDENLKAEHASSGGAIRHRLLNTFSRGKYRFTCWEFATHYVYYSFKTRTLLMTAILVPVLYTSKLIILYGYRLKQSILMFYVSTHVVIFYQYRLAVLWILWIHRNSSSCPRLQTQVVFTEPANPTRRQTNTHKCVNNELKTSKSQLKRAFNFSPVGGISAISEQVTATRAGRPFKGIQSARSQPIRTFFSVVTLRYSYISDKALL